jgi:hypothetical protein
MMSNQVNRREFLIRTGAWGMAALLPIAEGAETGKEKRVRVNNQHASERWCRGWQP